MTHNENITNTLLDTMGVLTSLGECITQVKLNPFQVGDGMALVMGVKRTNMELYELHLGDGSWVDVNLVDEDFMDVVAMELLDRYKELKEKRRLVTMSLTYVLNGSDEVVEETIVYENKKDAYKESVMKKRLCSSFSIKFVRGGETSEKTRALLPSISMSDEEFAHIALY